MLKVWEIISDMTMENMKKVLTLASNTESWGHKIKLEERRLG